MFYNSWMRYSIRAQLGLAGLLMLVGCVFACSQEATPASAPLKFANEKLLDDHWRKHGLNIREFDPVLTKDQYLKAAQRFFALKETEVEVKRRPNGDSLRYRISTNEFGVQRSDKVIRTYFRPDSGIRYWHRQ
jgi:pyocin large subunit-like protein